MHDVSAKAIQPAVLWPQDIEQRYGVTSMTRWRWEREKKLPPRDVYLGDKPAGWYRTTIEAAERGPVKSAA